MESATTSTLKSFHFLDLPTELRAKCYKLVARNTTVLKVDYKLLHPANYTNLISTCRQIRNEAAGYQPRITELTTNTPHHGLPPLTKVPTPILHNIHKLSIGLNKESSHRYHDPIIPSEVLQELPNLTDVTVFVVVEDVRWIIAGSHIASFAEKAVRDGDLIAWVRPCGSIDWDFFQTSRAAAPRKPRPDVQRV